jgi:hypothetical protein
MDDTIHPHTPLFVYVMGGYFNFLSITLFYTTTQEPSYCTYRHCYANYCNTLRPYCFPCYVCDATLADLKLFCYQTHSNTTITLRQHLSGQTKVALDSMKICALTRERSTLDSGTNTLTHAMRNVAQHSIPL